MTATIQTLLLLLSVLVVVDVLAKRLGIAPSILMVSAGVAIALIPGLPSFVLPPELVLLGILPPLIYSAGVQMSWREFRFNLRPIALLAIGYVAFTTCLVAVAAHLALGLAWPVGFVLGAIVAPPDVIAPISIARRLGLPRRILVVLEGEGLANDGTALVLYRFAVAAVSLGVFSPGKALVTFSLILVGELVYGLAIGWFSLRLRQWARDPRIEITLSLMTPYLAYWLPAHLGGSGVLATIATGLYVSWNGPLLIGSATRLQGVFFWDLIVYLIQGLVFLITGLQLRTLLERVHAVDVAELLVATGLTTAVVIIARFAWTFPTTYLPRWLSKSLARRDPAPPWQAPFMIAFVGVRGVVSLAAALALPMATSDGRPFPGRDLILFVAFGVIVITLVGEGLLMSKVVDWLGLARGAAAEHALEQAQEHAARATALDTARRRLEEIAAERELPEHVVRLVRARHDDRQQLIPADLGTGLELTRASTAVRSEVIEEERRVLHQLLRDGKLTDESRRRIERELDLEAETIACRSPDDPL